MYLGCDTCSKVLVHVCIHASQHIGGFLPFYIEAQFPRMPAGALQAIGAMGRIRPLEEGTAGGTLSQGTMETYQFSSHCDREAQVFLSASELCVALGGC